MFKAIHVRDQKLERAQRTELFETLTDEGSNMSSGGPGWIRTIDLTVISRAL